MKIRKYINNKFHGHTKLTVENVKRLEKISELNGQQPHIHKYLSKPTSVHSIDKIEREDSNDYEKQPFNASDAISKIHNTDEMHYTGTGAMGVDYGDARSHKSRSIDDTRSHHSRSAKHKSHHKEDNYHERIYEDDDAIHSLTSNNLYPCYERSLNSVSNTSRGSRASKTPKSHTQSSGSRKAPPQHHRPPKRPSTTSSYKESSGESVVMPLPRLYKDVKTLSQQNNHHNRHAAPIPTQRFSISEHSDV